MILIDVGLQILALDPDAGENGTVRYSTRGAGGFRVEAHSGRLYARTAPAAGALRHVAVRACDGGRPQRCAVTRVSVTGAPFAAAEALSAWRVTAPGPLTAAELDPPGYLLAVLQPDAAPPLYYDIVGEADFVYFYFLYTIPRAESHIGY